MRIRVAKAVVLCSFFSALALGQGTTSRLVGVVTDASGAAVASVTVKLTSEGTGSVFSTSTGNGGAYSFEAVQPGKYEVSGAETMLTQAAAN